MTIETCKLFVNGEWVSSSASETSPVYNPSEGIQIAATPMCGSDEISNAIEAAHAAFPDWADTPPVERARLMFRFKELLGSLKARGMLAAETRRGGERGEDSDSDGVEAPSAVRRAPVLLPELRLVD